MIALGFFRQNMRKMGENKTEEARSDFTTLTLISVLIGMIFSTIFLFFIFSPKHKGENGYRYYTYSQSIDLENILALRELNRKYLSKTNHI